MITQAQATFEAYLSIHLETVILKKHHRYM